MKYSHLDFWSTIFFYSIQICYFLQMSYNQYIWDTCVTHIFALKNVLYVHWTFDKIFDDQKSNYPSKDECDELQYKDWAAFLFMFRKFQQFRNMTYVTDELHPKPITLYQIFISGFRFQYRESDAISGWWHPDFTADVRSNYFELGANDANKAIHGDAAAQNRKWYGQMADDDHWNI